MRRVSTAGRPWHTIVGVVRDLGTIHDNPRDLAGLYHPAAPGRRTPMHIAVHVRGEPGSFAPTAPHGGRRRRSDAATP